eukprot:970132_1
MSRKTIRTLLLVALVIYDAAADFDPDYRAKIDDALKNATLTKQRNEQQSLTMQLSKAEARIVAMVDPIASLLADLDLKTNAIATLKSENTKCNAMVNTRIGALNSDMTKCNKMLDTLVTQRNSKTKALALLKIKHANTLAT